MTDLRYAELMLDDSATLTPDELAEGWHWCPEWDDLLVWPGMEEANYCEGDSA